MPDQLGPADDSEILSEKEEQGLREKFALSRTRLSSSHEDAMKEIDAMEEISRKLFRSARAKLTQYYREVVNGAHVPEIPLNLPGPPTQPKS